MQLAALLLIASQTPVEANVQTWQKMILPGLTYRMEVDPTIPRLVHAVRVSLKSDQISLLPELAQGQVFNPDLDVLGRETVSAMAVRSNALLTINADFFPLSGDPLGVMVRNGELMSSPANGRSCVFWGPEGFFLGYLTFAATVGNGRAEATIYGVNEECGDNMVVLNTPRAGYAISREPATHAVLELKGPISPKGEWTAKLKRFVTDAVQVPVGEGEVVLTYRGTHSKTLNSFELGKEVTIKVDCGGADWKKALNAIGGGPFILRKGEELITYADEGFRESFSTSRHPRSSIGVTADGDVWIVAVDGRQAMSGGATLPEMAEIMKRLGCRDAINLDGGGSTTLNLGGVTLNRPSGGQERAVANALVVLAARRIESEGEFVIAGAAEIEAGKSANYKVVDSSGLQVPQSEVFWSAHGSAWIDQSGVLHSFEEGVATLTAFVRGKIVRLTLTSVKRA